MQRPVPDLQRCFLHWAKRIRPMPRRYTNSWVASPQISFLRSRNELLITDTELKLMATAAIIGESSRPKKG